MTESPAPLPHGEHMNVLRRLFLSFYSLLLAGAAAGFIVLTWNDSDQLDVNLIRKLNLRAFITAPNTNAQVLFTVILGAIITLALFTFVLSYLPQGIRSSTKGALRLKQADGGTVDVPVSALETLLREELEALPEIRSAKPIVRVTGGVVSMDLFLAIEPSASIAQVTALAGNTCAHTLKEQVGVTAVRRPHVRISYDEVSARPIGMAAGTGSVNPRYAPPTPVQPTAPAKDASAEVSEEPHD